MTNKKEAKARIKINKLLEEAGWRFFDTEEGKANIILENNVKITEEKLNELGENFQKTKNGFVDFLLLDEKGFPLVILEAKAEDKNPLDGKEQSRRYAQSQNARFIILSNGNLNYFWDLESGNPNIITTFPAYESIYHKSSFEPNTKSLIEEKVEGDYIALTQKPSYRNDLDWGNKEKRENFIKKNDLKFLRDYQLKAVNILQKAVKEGKDRFLFEMATGTGKTLVSEAIIKLFLKTKNAKRVLFLVDRLELEDQAKKVFVKDLKNDYKTVIYKESKDDWRRAEIVVSTVQSLLFNNKYEDLFSPTDFDLVISDEAHRSIGGNARAVFEYFLGYKLGLTATPKDYLKNIDPEKVNDKDPRQLERRQLLDTYQTFGCESGTPTYRYSLLDGVKDDCLVNPKIIDARTEITTQLLSEKGYSIILPTEEGTEEQKSFYHKDFEKKFFSKKTNIIFCKTFMENALKDPITNEIGKGIIFCVSQKHASKITKILNEMAEVMFKGKYNSDFAVQITSNIPDSQQMTLNFANNNLNGHTKFLEGYKTSKTRVCVTVGMMTTGYDCQDLLNIGLLRPIFSPTDFVQIKGRGTRKYEFKHKQKNNFGEIEDYQFKKKEFKLFDFFANCEYFEEKFDYDEIIKLPKISSSDTEKGIYSIRGIVNKYKNYNPDPLKFYSEIDVGLEGMKVDYKLFEKFEKKIKCDDYIKENFSKGNLEEAEDYIRDKIFEKPTEYFNLEKLRKSVKADRRISLREILEKIFGRIQRFKTKNELLEEEFGKFVSIYKPDNKKVLIIKNFMKAYLTDHEIREIMEKKQFQRLATNPKVTLDELKDLGNWKEKVIEYVKDYVPLNNFN